MDSKSAFAKVSGQGLKVLLKVAKKIESLTTFKREDNRGAKTQNFPGGSFLRAKTFRTKCAKPFLTTTLKSVLSPLVTLPENA